MSTQLKQCIVEKSGCCETVIEGAKMGIEMAIAQVPQLNTVCPQLVEVFTNICADQEEGGEDGADGKGKQGTSIAGNVTVCEYIFYCPESVLWIMPSSNFYFKCFILYYFVIFLFCLALCFCSY